MTFKLELRHLMAVNAVAQTGNGTRAAPLLHISQSALSHRLHEAERRLDVKLYRQVGKRLELTPAGERINLAAIQCLEEIRRAEEEVDLRKHDVRHVVRLGVSVYASFGWLPGLIRDLQENETGIEVEIETEVSPNLVELLNQNRIHLAMTTGPVRTRKITSTLLYRDELLAVLPADHPKAGRSWLRATDFEDETFVTETMEREWMGKSKTLFERLGSAPRRIMRVGHREAALALISSGMAMTAETRGQLGIYEKKKGIVIRPITKKGLFVEYYLASAARLDESGPEAVVASSLRSVIGPAKKA